jgi:hypothetical protein
MVLELNETHQRLVQVIGVNLFYEDINNPIVKANY